MLGGHRMCRVVKSASAPPAITSLNYDQGDTAGGGQDIVITGTGFTGATAVTFLGTAATSYTVDSDTQITAVLPAHAAGSGNVEVTGPGGSDTIAFEFWGPTSEGAAAHWAADYAGSPWQDLVTSEDLSEATNAPSVGTTVNGFDPADFDGTNDKLTSTSAASSFMSASAYTGWALVRVRTASAGGTDYTDIYSRDGIVGSASNAQDWGVGVRSDNTVGVYHYGGGNFDGVTVGITLNSWQLVQWKYDGTNLKLRVNGGSWGSIAKGSVASLAQSVLVGESQVAGTEYADMLLLDLGLDSSAWSDASLDKLRKFVNQRYGMTT